MYPTAYQLYISMNEMYFSTFWAPKTYYTHQGIKCFLPQHFRRYNISLKNSDIVVKDIASSLTLPLCGMLPCVK